MNKTVVVTDANNRIGFTMTEMLLEDRYCVTNLDIADEILASLNPPIPKACLFPYTMFRIKAE